jgi:threonine dehydrogenase-like Zn-dependent dehydrogenase
VDCVLEAVGTEESFGTAVRSARPGGRIGRVGLPQFASTSELGPAFQNNLTISGGVAPARAYIEELLPEVLDGALQPGRVFDLTVSLDESSAGYRAMNEREAIKALIVV